MSEKKQIQTDFQFTVSDLMLTEGLINSTSLLENSLPYFDEFRNANSSWLEEIKINENTNSYLIGQITEESSFSSANKKITVASVSFSGRLVQLNPFRVHPIRISKKGSSFNEADAFNDTRSELAKSITAQTAKIIKGL